DVLAVLVGAGQEERGPAAQPARARERVGGDRCVGVADVRDVVQVVDGRRQVVRRLVVAHPLLGRALQAAIAAAWTSLIATPRAVARRWQSSNSGCAFTTAPRRRPTFTATGP